MSFIEFIKSLSLFQFGTLMIIAFGLMLILYGLTRHKKTKQKKKLILVKANFNTFPILMRELEESVKNLIESFFIKNLDDRELTNEEKKFANDIVKNSMAMIRSELFSSMETPLTAYDITIMMSIPCNVASVYVDEIKLDLYYTESDLFLYKNKFSDSIIKYCNIED